jgi:hypothetical protein
LPGLVRLPQETNMNLRKSGWLATAVAVIAWGAGATAHAQEKFTFLTNWYAIAEHGGFYQAITQGLYKKAGLDVTIKMGGPQVNGMQLLAAGQADCYLGFDVQTMKVREQGVEAVTVAAVFQKDPQVMIGHPEVFKKMEDLKGKTILISGDARTNYWPWLRSTYNLQESQARPPVQRALCHREEGRLQAHGTAAGRPRLAALRLHHRVHGKNAQGAAQGRGGFRQGLDGGLEELPQG